MKSQRVDIAERPETRGFRPPMVYVYEETSWEYKRVSRKLDQEGPLLEGEMNALGAEGWELVGVVGHPNGMDFYFKRRPRARGAASESVTR